MHILRNVQTVTVPQLFQCFCRWSVGAMVLGNFLCRGVLLIWITVGQGPTALEVGVGMGCLDFFSVIFSFFSLCLGDGPM